MRPVGPGRLGERDNPLVNMQFTVVDVGQLELADLTGPQPVESNDRCHRGAGGDEELMASRSEDAATGMGWRVSWVPVRIDPIGLKKTTRWALRTRNRQRSPWPMVARGLPEPGRTSVTSSAVTSGGLCVSTLPKRSGQEGTNAGTGGWSVPSGVYCAEGTCCRGS